MSATARPWRALTALLAGLCLCVAGLVLDPVAAVGLATVTGKVTDAAHVALPGAGVSIFVWADHGGGAGSFDYLGTELTGADGSYTWPALGAGDYYARVSLDGYATAYSGGATTDPLTLAHPGVFHLADGAGHREDFALAADPSGLGTLTGTVTDADGVPVDALQVEAVPAVPTQQVNPLTYSVSGSYTLHLAPGDYALRFHDASNRFPDQDLPGPLSVTPDHATTVPTVALRRPRAVTATGSVTEAGGSPLAGARVVLWRVLSSGPHLGLAFVSDTVTGPDGRYELTGLGEGLEYTVEAGLTGYRSRYLGDRADPTSPDRVVAADTNALGPIHLPVANQVTGAVSGAGAGPLAEVRVWLLRWTPGDGGSSFLRTSDVVVTGADGRFSLAALDPGDYSLYFEAPDDSVFDSGYLGGRSLPPGTATAAGTFHVAAEDSDVTGQDVVLSRRLHGSGHVASSSGDVAGATVEAYRWDETSSVWDLYDEAVTDAAGDYDLRLPHDATVTVSVTKNRYVQQFLGGRTSLPAAPSAGDHLDTQGADVAFGTYTLHRRPTALGSGAGEDLPYCYDHDLSMWSDASSRVRLPAGFPLRFFGTAYDEIFVNDNGNITFGGDNVTFTPEDLTTTDLPVIAPFWADMDARGNGVAASYGFSPDGSRFCAVWSDMGFYDRHADRLDTVQLLLTSADGDPGRSEGDFDITFDYDRVGWDAGDFDGGLAGLAGAGGRSAVAGFSAGTGAPGTSFQLDGSLVPGALVDGGPDALVAGTAASTTPGRYVFQVRNDGSTATAGTVSGTVTDQYGREVAGAEATLLRSDIQGGGYAPVPGGTQVTDPAGGFSMDVPPGWYQVDAAVDGCATGSTPRFRVPVDRRGVVARMTCTAAPPSAARSPGITGSGRVGDTLTAVAAAWPAPLERRSVQWLRNGAEIAGATGTTYTPTPDDLGATVSVRETAGRPDLVRDGATVSFATVDAVSSGVAVRAGAAPAATVPPGLVGTARVGRALTATPGAWTRAGLDFGYEWLRDGTPIAGANDSTLSLTAADAGAAVAVRVTATRPGYESGSATSASTVVATGSGAATTGVPRIVGRPAAGRRVVADPGTWAGIGWTFHLQWLRDGSPVPGAVGTAYTPSAEDIGAALSVRVTATQPGFDAGTATSAAVRVGRFASTVTLRPAGRPGSTAARPKVRVAVAAPGAGAPTGKVRIVQRGHVVRTVRLRAHDHGAVTARLAGLEPGRYRIRADYTGSARIDPSRSTTVVLRVR